MYANDETLILFYDVQNRFSAIVTQLQDLLSDGIEKDSDRSRPKSIYIILMILIIISMILQSVVGILLICNRKKLAKTQKIIIYFIMLISLTISGLDNAMGVHKI